ncbi:hypothetical protein P676_2419 [Acinetobacter baumannii UH7607]|nr:hypothetical protein P662_2676 [Acinetobacter baumannii UH22908]ETR05192.1 hypothetical protein P676_2419 [Acinetobacter baumannii UH7607]ETR05645.1 hypothetical protein P674_2090 [Acinetobacter baumannii UH6907]ETR24104.1 hypothetical protein P679_2603 [Acinetobacter baumannii UH7907]
MDLNFLNHLCDEQQKWIFVGSPSRFLNHLCDEQLMQLVNL